MNFHLVSDRKLSLPLPFPSISGYTVLLATNPLQVYSEGGVRAILIRFIFMPDYMAIQQLF